MLWATALTSETHSPNPCGLTPNPSPEGRGMVCFKG